jgi:hypothetical protein
MSNDRHSSFFFTTYGDRILARLKAEGSCVRKNAGRIIIRMVFRAELDWRCNRVGDRFNLVASQLYFAWTVSCQNSLQQC